MEKYIFSGHESFSLREGWLVKGIRMLNDKEKNKSMFTGKELINTIDHLGIGANMVKSLKHWLEIYDIIDENNILTPFVNEISKYDEYMQHTITLWLLHFMALNPKRNRRAKIWDVVSYKYKNAPFTKEQMVDLIDSETGKKYSKNTIETSLTVYLRTYISELEKVENDPENNLISPFSRLQYLNKDLKTDEYSFRSIEYKELNPYFGFLILKAFCENETEVINRIEKIDAYNKFKLIVKMDSYNFEMLLKEMENNKLISIDRAAGLNNINLTSDMDEVKIVENIYRNI